jgi:hypothetical protein
MSFGTEFDRGKAASGRENRSSNSKKLKMALFRCAEIAKKRENSF